MDVNPTMSSSSSSNKKWRFFLWRHLRLSYVSWTGRHRVENRVGEVRYPEGCSVVKMIFLAPEIQRVCVCGVTFFTAVLSNCTHFTAKYTKKTYFTLIYVQTMYKFMANMLFMVLMVRLVFGLSMSRRSQR